ncbi:AsnC family transcriptional regulator [Boseaceae bacterium BT-24-1]|nr:AsnC family transcriptional regulator [Boseaceae bacterium BT-24-1]
MALDHLSRVLLSELVEDGRASHTKLAERIGLSATAVARRQRALEEEGVIVGYHARLSQKVLGLLREHALSAPSLAPALSFQVLPEATDDQNRHSSRYCPHVLSCEQRRVRPAAATAQGC